MLVIYKLCSQEGLASYWFFMCFDQFSFYIFPMYSVQWCWSICPNNLFWIIYDNFSIWLGQYPNFPFGYNSGFGQKSSRQDWFDCNKIYHDQFINYFCLHNWWPSFATNFLIVSYNQAVLFEKQVVGKYLIFVDLFIVIFLFEILYSREH